ncbi:MAG: hypothetical protein AB7T58_05345 [Hyphomonadaceae bacterium]
MENPARSSDVDFPGYGQQHIGLGGAMHKLCLTAFSACALLASAPRAVAQTFAEEATEVARVLADYPGQDEDAVARRIAAFAILRDGVQNAGLDAGVDAGPNGGLVGGSTPRSRQLATAYGSFIDEEVYRHGGRGGAADRAALQYFQSDAFLDQLLARYFSRDVASSFRERFVADRRMRLEDPAAYQQMMQARAQSLQNESRFGREREGIAADNQRSLMFIAIGTVFGAFGLWRTILILTPHKLNPGPPKTLTARGRTYFVRAHTVSVKRYRPRNETIQEADREVYQGSRFLYRIRGATWDIFHEDMDVEDASGRVQPIRLRNWHIGPNIGDVLTLIWLAKRPDGDGQYIAVRNDTTRAPPLMNDYEVSRATSFTLPPSLSLIASAVFIGLAGSVAAAVIAGLVAWGVVGIIERVVLHAKLRAFRADLPKLFTPA